jgi:DNA excision repair protein ERCC-2
MMRLPYPPRPGQAELVAAIHRSQSDGGHLVTEAGTGTGKTVTALTASLATTRADHRRLVYATRTNAQQTQVIREHAALVKENWPESGVEGTARAHPIDGAAAAATSAAQATGAAPLLVPFMGRKQYCPLLRSDDRFADGTPEELGRLCRDAKRKAQQAHDLGKPVEGACPFYARLLVDGPGPVEALLRGGLDGGELASRVEAAGSCPYEALKMLLPKADVVVLPLIFLLDDRLRRALQQWLGTGLDECHLVVDEAHHLPQAAREHHSPSLSSTALIRAQKEAEEYNDPLLAGSHLSTTVLDALLRALHALSDEFVRDGEDGLVPPGALSESLLGTLRVPSTTLARIAADLVSWGENVREDKRSKGRLPRSHLGSVGAFLQSWLALLDAPYVHLVTGGENPALELFLLDPAPVLGWMGEFWSTTQMSGTLAPLDEHALLCGLSPERTTTLRMPSPFDPRNLRVAALEGVHRRYEAVQRDPATTIRQQEAARDALARMPGRTGLFFPSHRMLREYLEEGFLHGVARPQHVERADMDAAELGRLVDAFRRDPRPGALLLGVLGGRLTEGLDFPGDAMEHMLLFGIPYPRPSARSQALIHHYDAKSGNGWMVAVHNPVGRTLRQAIGRLIRGPDDRGTAVILDERAVRFHDHLPDLRMLAGVSDLDVAWTPGAQTKDLRSAWSAEKGYVTASTLPRRAPPGA